VFVYDKNVNLEMVKAGLAEYYRGEKPKRFDRMPYQLAETKAKNEGIGMWSLGNQYISPKDWRKMHR
jgi:endonuclease YncB( thermonuclease family)